ncbi:thiolase family protein [Pseudonocardia sichuanensis]
MSSVALVGAGMTRFGRYPEESIKGLAAPAVQEALADAGLDPADIDMAFVANAMAALITGQSSVVGQSVLRHLGFSGIPVYNVDNACAGGATALNLAVHAVRAGAAEAVLVLGVEKMVTADKSLTFRALNGAADVDFVAASGVDPGTGSVFVSAVYPPRLQAYADRYPLSAETLAGIAVKNRAHAALNPMAQYVTPLTVDEVLQSRTVAAPVTALMCAPISDGAAAVVVVRGDRVRPVQRPVWVRSSAVGMAAGGDDISTIQRVSRRVYAEAGIGPDELHVAEVHDSIAFNELHAYEELGLCGPGEGTRLVTEGATSLGGPIPVNPSGGLESRGHPVAATGIGQVIELMQQLRGDAGDRQVPDARHGLAESAGGFAGGDTAAVAVTLLSNEQGA